MAPLLNRQKGTTTGPLSLHGVDRVGKGSIRLSYYLSIYRGVGLFGWSIKGWLVPLTLSHAYSLLSIFLQLPKHIRTGRSFPVRWTTLAPQSFKNSIKRSPVIY